MGGLSQKRMRLIVETLSHNLRSVGTIFALLKKRMPVNRGIRLYQLSNSGGQRRGLCGSLPATGGGPGTLSPLFSRTEICKGQRSGKPGQSTRTGRDRGNAALSAQRNRRKHAELTGLRAGISERPLCAQAEMRVEPATVQRK